MQQVMLGIVLMISVLTVSQSALAETSSYFDRPEGRATKLKGEAEVFNHQLRRLTTAIENDDRADAILASEAALVLGEMGENPEILAEISLNLARMYALGNEYTKAEDSYDAAIQLLRAANGEGDERTFDPLMEYIKYLVSRTRPNKARRLFEELISLTGLDDGEETVKGARLLLLESDLLSLEVGMKVPGQLRWTRVMKMRKSLKQARKTFIEKGDYSGAADTYFFWGRIEDEARRGGAAAGHLKKAIEHYERAGAQPNDLRLIRCHSYLAQIYYRLDEIAKAGPHIEFVTTNQTVTDESGLVPLYRLPPRYPFLANAFKRRGWVLVEFNIGKDGSITSQAVLDADPPDVFNDAALEAVQQWRYVPVRKDGVPVDFKTKVVLTFVPSDGKDHTWAGMRESAE